jgi:copper transport protein
MSQISHAAGLTFWANGSVLADFIHLSAVGAWIGGLFVLALVLRPAIQPLSAELRGQAIQAVLRRFSLFALIAVSLIIATGIYATTISVPQPINLTNTTYGLTLLAKWILMLPLLGLGAVHFLLLSPDRFASAAARVNQFTSFAHFPQSIRLEAIFAFLVVLAASVLPATPPPIPPDARAEVELETQSLDIEGYSVELAVSPAAVGANSLDVRITRDGQPVEMDQVKMRFSYPEYGSYTDLMLLDQSAPELWIGASSIDRAGNWDALIDFTPAGEQPIRAALELDFAAEVKGARSPSVLNWLAGFGILAALGVCNVSVGKTAQLDS